MSSSAPVAPLGEVRVAELASIRPYERNPRKIPARAVEQTAKSIKEFGWQQPIVVDADLVVVVGHTRLAAAKSLGLTHVPIIVAEHLTPAQAKAFRVADNRTHDYTSWDYSVLIDELDGLGGDFADVLDIADWTKLLAEFQQAGNGVHMLPEPEGDPLVSTGFTLTVEFVDQVAADSAGPQLLAIPGVLNVRHTRT